jgi:hypothetical protein
MPEDNNKAYKQYLVQFMSFTGGLQFDVDYQFTGQELAPITPNQLVQWMCVKVYGIPNPGPDDNPTKGRSSSLEDCKKSISSLIPHRLQPWNLLTNFGNPTRSVEVNDLIKRVKNNEVVRRQGESKSSKTCAGA